MNTVIETLNLWGANALRIAWPLLWQSSLLIGLLFAVDVLLRRRLRASVRYALWLVVLLKLVLPPALSFPTGVGWWVQPQAPAPVKPAAVSFVVSYGPDIAARVVVPVDGVPLPPPRVAVSGSAWAMVASGAVSLGLLAWMLIRWGRLARDIRQAAAAPSALRELLEEARQSLGLGRHIRFQLTQRPMSPAVCGLFRPVILLPQSLAEQLPLHQLRPVLLHELVHLRRGDVWVNCAQALLQLLYWWHPLLWLANARIRQVREEAVDDAVMLALRDDAETYAPTLLEVAKLALQRRMPSLGLVGILESRHSLRRRIQRLLDFHPPRRAGLSLASTLCVAAFAAVAVPMGQAPARSEKPSGLPALTGQGEPSGPLVAEGGGGGSETRWRALDGNSQADQTNVERVWEKLGGPESATNEAEHRVLVPAETLRRVEVLRDMGKLELWRQETLLAKLKSLTPVEQAVPIATLVPDALLGSLLEQRTLVEEKLSTARKVLGTNSAEVIKLASVRDDLNSRIADRVTGVMLGLDARVGSPRLNLTNLERGVEAATSKDVTTTNQSRAYLYLEAKRQLEKLQAGQSRELGISPDGQFNLNSILTDPQFRMGVQALNDRAAATAAANPSEERASSAPVVSAPGRVSEGGFDWYLGSVLTNSSSPGSQQLSTRRFRIDHDKFFGTYRVWAGLPEDAGPIYVSEAVRDYLKAKGVDLTPPKSIFYSDTRAQLFIRATQADLDAVSTVLQDFAPSPGSTNIFTRRFQVDQSTFMPRVRVALGVTETGPADLRFDGKTVRNFFASKGVDLSPPKSVFFSDGLGLLFVRASTQDLDKVESLIYALNTASQEAPAKVEPPQIMIKAHFIQLPEADAAAFCTRFAATNSPGATNWSVTLSAAQAAEQLAQWKKGPAEFLGSPAMTTLSGRKAQLSVEEFINVVTRTNSAPETNKVSVGTVVTVNPIVVADGRTIHVDVTASLIQFVGYDNPNPLLTQLPQGTVLTPTILPRFRVREVGATANVSDGQTLVMGGPATEDISTLRDKVPILGDVPVLGRLFRSESTSTRRMHLFLLLTPTLIDSAGNPVHAGREQHSPATPSR